MHVFVHLTKYSFRKRKEHLTNNLVKKSKKKRLKRNAKPIISSEAWPADLRNQYSIASIHELFSKNPSLEITEVDITFKQVTYEHVDQVRELHEEW